jgi:hypothetical protein
MITITIVIVIVIIIFIIIDIVEICFYHEYQKADVFLLHIYTMTNINK